MERFHEENQMRVSDQERERVVEVLGKAAGEGRLDLDEYTERVGQAYQAKTRQELAELTRDLPTSAYHLAKPQPGPELSPASVPASDRLEAIFGEDSRRGSWLVPSHLTVRAIFGECQLDFKHAQIQREVTTIMATVVFGSVTLWVPEGTAVCLSGRAILGSKESRLRSPVVAGAPVINVHCNVVFGEVIVRPVKP